jgi:hypothetical protein
MHDGGRLVAVNQLTIDLGVLGAQAVNWLICAAGAGRRHDRGDPAATADVIAAQAS